MRQPLAAALCTLLSLGLFASSEPAFGQGYGGAPEAPGGASAQGDKPEKEKKVWGKRDKEKFGKSKTVRERTGKRLNNAYEYIQAERFDEAEAELKKLRLRSLNPIERAKYHQIYAQLENARKDPAEARKHLELALAEEAFSPADEAQTLQQIAGIYLGESKWAEAAEHLNRWFEVTETPTASAYYLLALAYYQMEKMDEARVAAEKSIELSDPPLEGSLQLLLAIRLTNREYAEAEPVLLQLVQRYPKKIYWVQLSTLYGAQGDYEKALVYLELAQLQGMLTEDEELRRLTQLLLARDIPYPAAQLLEKALQEKRIRDDANAFELLSTAWIQARDFDKALPPLAKAAELSEDGKLYIRLAQVYLQREELEPAEEALRKAMDKGGLPNPGDAQLLMGIVLFGKQKHEQALSWFERATAHAETREEAQIWVKHIQQQLPTLAAAGGGASSN